MIILSDVKSTSMMIVKDAVAEGCGVAIVTASDDICPLTSPSVNAIINKPMHLHFRSILDVWPFSGFSALGGGSEMAAHCCSTKINLSSIFVKTHLLVCIH